MSIKIDRYFTEKGKSPFDQFEYELRTALIGKEDNPVFKQENVEVPKDWSQVATDIIASKYFKRAGIPNIGHESSAKQVMHRLALTWSNWGEKMGYFTNKEDKQAYYDEVVYMLLDQRFAPNSPQFFNTGLYDAYGITGEKRGMWRVDPETGEAYQTENEYVNPTPQACFILKEHDDLLSMMEGIKTETILFRAGSGVGSNFGVWRARNERISGGGKSSGLISFLKVRDANAGSIKSGGISRRAAKMVCIDDKHPDIEEFIEWKSSEEEKVRALGKMGYDTDFNGVAYDTVSGQNSNNSIRATDDFMKAVINDSEWELEGRTDKSINRKVKARYLWHKINQAGWRCADPALQYHTTINDWNTCSNDGDINSSNPCFTGNMRLLTSDGYKTFAELDGQTVEVMNKDGIVVHGKVWCSGEKEIVKVRLSNGSIITCTPDHVFMTNTGDEVEAQDLKGKRVMPFISETKDLDMEFVLLGFVQGDGQLTRLNSEYHKGIEVNVGQGDLEVRYLFRKNYEIVEYDNDRVIYVSGLNNRLSELGFDAKILPERLIPSTYSSWTLKQKRSFLRGCYSANGSVINVGRVAYKTTCREYAEQLVATLDQDFGIKAYITTNKPHDIEFSNGTYTVKESYDVNIANFEGMNKFYNEIGFIHRYKMFKLRDTLVEKAPKVTSVTFLNTTEKVYDFTEPMTHWGVVEGVIVHNCSEYHFLDNTACNLASINLLKFLNIETGEFDEKGYLHAIRLMQITLDISVTMAQLPSKEIAIGTYNYRTTGGGYGNLGQLLMTLGLPYDSQEGRALAGVLTSILTGQAYKTSAELAEVFGGFPRFKENKSSMRRVLHNHRVATYGDYATTYNLEYDQLHIKPIGLNHNLLSKLGFEGLSLTALNIWDDVDRCKLFNSAFVSCIAPTGTIGLLMDFDTTSLEPSFSLIAYKKLAGGGYMMIPNRGIGIALKRLGYTENEIKEILEYIKLNSNIENAPHIESDHLPIFDTANKNFGGERFIRPMGHVEMLAATSGFLSGSSSKTVNLPNDATVEDFEEVHMKSWELGVKCVALFRDGCKASQPMNVSLNSEDELTQKYENMKYDELVKLAYQLQEKAQKPTRTSPPSIRNAKVHEAKVGSMGILVKVGFYDDGKIAEVYADTNDSQIVKGLLNTLSILASHMIQRNVSISDITNMLRKEKFEPSGFVTKHPTIKRVESLGDLIAKVLELEHKKDVSITTQNFKTEDIQDAKENGKAVYGEKCSNCSGENLKQNGTCKVCLDCGSTTGCS